MNPLPEIWFSLLVPSCCLVLRASCEHIIVVLLSRSKLAYMNARPSFYDSSVLSVLANAHNEPGVSQLISVLS